MSLIDVLTRKAPAKAGAPSPTRSNEIRLIAKALRNAKTDEEYEEALTELLGVARGPNGNDSDTQD